MTLTSWPDTTGDLPPRDHPYRSATWLLGRHPRLARWAERIPGVINVEDGQLWIDLDHLGDVFASVPAYSRAWQDYESRHRPPRGDDESAYDRWEAAGPKTDDYARGLADLLVLSSGELGALRLLAMLSGTRVPFRLDDLSSLDDEGQRLLGDWCEAILTH